jgi:hypothetical protein
MLTKLLHEYINSQQKEQVVNHSMFDVFKLIPKNLMSNPKRLRLLMNE